MALQFNQNQFDAIRQNPDRLVKAISASTQQTDHPLKIRFGRRIIYGQLASGEERFELNEDRLGVLVEALQKPATPDAPPSDHSRKPPTTIQITAGDEVLFRQERDGTISKNQINLQIEQAQSQATPPEAAADVNITLAPNSESPKARAIATPMKQSNLVEQQVAQFLHEAGMAEAVMQDPTFYMEICSRTSPHDKLSIEGMDWKTHNSQSELKEPARLRSDHEVNITRLKIRTQEQSQFWQSMKLTVSNKGTLAFKEITSFGDNLPHITQTNPSVASRFVQDIQEQGFAEVAREQLQEFPVEQTGDGDLARDLKAEVIAPQIGASAPNPVLSSTLTETPSDSEAPISLAQQRQDIIAISSELANPMAETISGFDIQVSSIGGFDIWRSENALAVTQGDELIAFAAIHDQQTIRPFTPRPESLTPEERTLLATAGVDRQHLQQPVNNRQADWAQFQQFSFVQVAGRLPQADSATPALSESGAIQALQKQVEKLPESEKTVKTWLQKAVGAIQQQFEQARESVQGAGQTLQDWDSKGRETVSQVRASEEFQTLQAKVKQGVQTAGDWLSSRPEAVINHRFARDAFKLFNQGHDRTFENTYQVGDFQISRQGQHTFIVNNDEGDHLLQFRAQKSILPGRFSLNLQSVNGDAKDFYKAVQLFRKPEAQAIGAPDKEAAYAAQVQHAAETIQQALNSLRTDNLDTKDYRIQAAEDGLTISANDRKGPIYTHERSQLTPKDYKQLQQIGRQIMQETTQKSVQVNPPEAKRSPAEASGEHILDAQIIRAYISLREESEDLLTQTGFPNREYISLANAAGDTKLKALQAGVPIDTFDQAVTTHERRLQQARVEETAPVLAVLLNLEDTTRLEGKKGAVITWDKESHTLSITRGPEVTMQAEWTDAGWRDKGSQLSPADVEKITNLRPAIEAHAQRKQTKQTAQAEL